METIVKAKDQQAAEANKNASILLKELDLEKVIFKTCRSALALLIHCWSTGLTWFLSCGWQSREESKKQALAAKREKRKEKRKKKKEEQKRKQEEEEGQKTKEDLSEMQEQKEDSADGNLFTLAEKPQNWFLCGCNSCCLNF